MQTWFIVWHTFCTITALFHCHSIRINWTLAITDIITAWPTINYTTISSKVQSLLRNTWNGHKRSDICNITASMIQHIYFRQYYYSFVIFGFKYLFPSFWGRDLFLAFRFAQMSWNFNYSMVYLLPLSIIKKSETNYNTHYFGLYTRLNLQKIFQMGRMVNSAWALGTTLPSTTTNVAWWSRSCTNEMLMTQPDRWKTHDSWRIVYMWYYWPCKSLENTKTKTNRKLLKNIRMHLRRCTKDS